MGLFMLLMGGLLACSTQSPQSPEPPQSSPNDAFVAPHIEVVRV